MSLLFPSYRCSTCTTSAGHFHLDSARPITAQEALMYISNYGHQCVTKVPVNIKHSKCFFIHRGESAEEMGDVTCDDMPWLQKRGKISKSYYVETKGKFIQKCWPQRSGDKENANTQLVHVHKRKWSHAHEKAASKVLFEVDNEPVVLVQYMGLSDQPSLRLGNRHTRKKTNELIKKQLQSTNSLKRTLYKVREQVEEADELTGPSSLPTMRTVKHIKKK